MDLQVISRDGEPEYAVLPWAQYQALLKAAGMAATVVPPAAEPAEQAQLPGFEQLGALRAAKGIELAQLARTVGISSSYLQMIESGERQPDAAIRRSLAWEMGVAGWREES